MFEFLRDGNPTKSVTPGANRIAVPTQTTPLHSKGKRELIRVVLKDTLKMHGIPFDWLACETFIVPRDPATEELQIQLVVMKWNESLLRYASALQQQLLKGLDRFDPSVDHSKYVVSWRFSPECACPFSFMPEPDFWSQKAQSPAIAEQPSILDRRRSKRPKTARIYTREERDSIGKNDDGEYERTKLSPLR